MTYVVSSKWGRSLRYAYQVHMQPLLNRDCYVSMHATVDRMLTSAEHNGEKWAHASVLYYKENCILPDLRTLDSTFSLKVHRDPIGNSLQALFIRLRRLSYVCREGS
jgi:hypothetical protein